METRMSRAEIAFPVLLFVGVAALLAAGILVLDYPWAVIAFPFGAGSVMCALCAIQVALAGRRETSALTEEPQEPLTLSSLAWVFAIVVFVYAFGFVLGSAAYLLVYLRANGSSWRLSLAIAAVSLVATWGLFIKVLQVPLPLEPLWLP
jgi:ABC-type uncharacterized transport system permease subunit